MADFEPAYNYYPLGSQGFSGSTNVLTNSPPSQISDSNIVTTGGGTVLNGGTFQSSNYAPGVTGWKLDSNGNVYLAGSITATSGSIGGWSIGATTISSTGATFTSGSSASIAFGTTVPSSPTSGTGIYIDKTGLFGLSANTQNFKIDATNGNITAIAGSIAAFTLSGSTIAATNLTLTSGAANTANITVGTGSNAGGLNSANGSSDIAFWAGDTFANRATAAFRVTAGGALTATSATISGSVTATSGTIGGFSIGSSTLSATNLLLTSGGANVANIQVGTGVSLGGLNSANAAGDIIFWGGDTYANRASAPFRVTGAGAVSGSNFTLTGGSINGLSVAGIPNSTATDISLLEKTHNIVFSVTDADTIAWTSGTITFSNGRTFSISSGNTGNMSALTYIYLDPSASTTVLQTTTTASTAIGANKSLLGMAQNNTVTASFIPYGAGQPLIDGANIGALSIVAGNIAASTITAGKMNVSQLSAITADLGTITTGVVNLSSGTANIHSGQSAYNTGTGFWLEYNGGTPRFSIGDGTAASSMTWDGTNLTVNGSVLKGNVFYGSGSDGSVTISADTTLTRNMYYSALTVDSGKVLTTAGYQIFVNGTLTNNGTIRRNGNAGGTGGNGSGGTGGTAGAAPAALAAGTVAGAVVGVAGGTGATGNGLASDGGAGTAVTESVGVAGSAGGAGGGPGGNGGNGGTVNSTAVSGTQNIAEAIILRNSQSGSFNQVQSSAASGGGGGGLGGTSSGGGGGGGGGGAGPIVAIYAKTITNTGTISANGGAGGNGGNGSVNGSGGGGGGGGPGGVLVLVYRTLTNSGTIGAAGGAAGTKGTGAGSGVNGTDGTVGSSGVVIQLQE